MSPTDTPSFTNRDPTQPAFWDERFVAGFTPWDAGRVPPRFAWHVASLERGSAARVLVPGCGSGYEIAHLAAAGFDVLGIDISSARQSKYALSSDSSSSRAATNGGPRRTFGACVSRKK